MKNCSSHLGKDKKLQKILVLAKVEISRIKHGQSQTVETLINEEALLFAKYLRNEREIWIPRLGIPNCPLFQNT